MLAGNHVMIANGAGIIAIPIEHQREFTGLLIEFYETNKINKYRTLSTIIVLMESFD